MGEVFGERLRRLRLHAKIALSILAPILVIFGALLLIYLPTVRTVIVEENRRRAELLAAQLAQHLFSEPCLYSGYFILCFREETQGRAGAAP